VVIVADFPRKDAIKSQVLLFVADEDRQSPIIDFTIDKVIQDVANYCNLEVPEIPQALDNTIVALVNQYIDTHMLLPSQQKYNQLLKSLTEGDVSYSYLTPSEAYAKIQSANTVTDDFKENLKKFRKLTPNNYVKQPY
jgi:hypothetical protein